MTTTVQRPTTGTIVRQWARGKVMVTTINPVHGPMYHGRINHGRGGWSVVDSDHSPIGADAEVADGPAWLDCDYLDAETVLLAATTWADDTTPDPDEQL